MAEVCRKLGHGKCSYGAGGGCETSYFCIFCIKTHKTMYKYAMTKSCKTALLRKVPETARFHTFDILWKLTLRRLLLSDILWKQKSCRLPVDDILWKCAALVPCRFSGSRKNDTSKKSPKRSKKDKNPVSTARDILKSCVTGSITI